MAHVVSQPIEINIERRTDSWDLVCFNDRGSGVKVRLIVCQQFIQLLAVRSYCIRPLGDTEPSACFAAI